MFHKIQAWFTLCYHRMWLSRNRPSFQRYPHRHKPPQRIRNRYSSGLLTSLGTTSVIYFFCVFVFISALLDNGISSQRFESLVDNLWTELLGAAITFLIFQKILERRDQERDMLKVYRQLGSRANNTAVAAADVLREEGILTDGTLQGVYLQGANLQGANLKDAWMRDAHLAFAKLQSANLDQADLQGAELGMANLQGAYLGNSNLQQSSLQEAQLSEARLPKANLYKAHMLRTNLMGAVLEQADLQSANLEEANLEDANLSGATLQGARMWRANLQNATLKDANIKAVWLPQGKLQGADFNGADLQGAHLEEANLQGVNLTNANLEEAEFTNCEFDSNTVLPDGTYWSPEIDMNRFINRDFGDPNNPDPNQQKFWRPKPITFNDPTKATLYPWWYNPDEES